jgi:hypothetical protein
MQARHLVATLVLLAACSAPSSVTLEELARSVIDDLGL